jgi:hypothetical protein
MTTSQTKRRHQQAGKPLSKSSVLEPAPQTPQQSELVTRANLMNKIQESLAEMPIVYVQNVAEFVTIMERYQGCTSPAENFIVTLVEMYAWGHATPEEAELKLEDFRSDFEHAIKTTRFMISRYPDLLTEKSESYKDVA